ncbi:MAG: hypothetical protein KAJ14_08540, partial [Candidatus Omnitrophica bacterium]|nr:hypothetical protein [Candidatus Omnitrophota bacterium]
MGIIKNKVNSKVIGQFNLNKSLSEKFSDIPKLGNWLKIENGFVSSEFPFVKIGRYRVLIIGKILSILSKKYKFTNYTSLEELIISLYYEYGKDFYSLLDGNFLILFYDDLEKEFVIF